MRLSLVKMSPSMKTWWAFCLKSNSSLSSLSLFFVQNVTYGEQLGLNMIIWKQISFLQGSKRWIWRFCKWSRFWWSFCSALWDWYWYLPKQILLHFLQFTQMLRLVSISSEYYYTRLIFCQTNTLQRSLQAVWTKSCELSANRMSRFAVVWLGLNWSSF